jgi:spore germination protein KA
MKKRSFRKEKRKKQKLQERYEQKLEAAVKDMTISKHIDENMTSIKKILGDSPDLVARTLHVPSPVNSRASVIYLDDMVNKDIVHNFIIRSLMICSEQAKQAEDRWEMMIQRLLQAGEIKEQVEMSKAIDGILTGDTLLFLEGFARVLVIGTKGWAARSVGEPKAESLIRGPREALSESLTFSLSMIRHRLKDPYLRVKSYILGEHTHTSVNLLYIDGIVDPTIVEEVQKRIQSIKIDGVLESGYIEEMIEDHVWTPFPQLQNTERPDTVVSHLLEGKVAILVDGTPFALIAPAVFSQFYQSPEDYYERYLVATSLRVVRLFSLFISLLLPALYISFVSFHPEMISTKLAFSMAAGRASVPFTPIVEALIMEVSVEILREASIRLPGPMGPTIGIVGGLVIGNAAVAAGLVSPSVLMRIQSIALLLRFA